METSPFSISEQNLRTLESSKSFGVVQTYLSRQPDASFCSHHASLAPEHQSTFILHRDIIHSLLLPIVQIRSQAALFASHTLASQQAPRSTSPRRSVVDLELAFRGHARGAFSWLQCFVAEERDWCATKGCPACVVLKVLHAEPFIRIVVAACRLSSYLKEMVGAQKANSSPDGGLPTFEFWLSAVHHAVSEDEFWGRHFWEDIEARAEDLERGVKHLIAQCSTQPASRSPAATQGRSASSGHIVWASGVKNGEMFARHLILRQEEQEWMRKIITACWATLLTEAARERRKISATKRPIASRMRSMTT